MRARIKATGDTYEITWHKDNVLRLEDGNIYPVGELDLLVDEPDWQHYRIQAAIEFAAQILANHGGATTSVAEDAVTYADALIAELKKGGNNDSTTSKD